MAGSNGYSKTQWAMLQILKDGKPHRSEELQSCCGPSSPPVVRLHIKALCSKLPIDYDIASLRRKNISHYVLVRYPENGHPVADPRPY